MTVEYDKYDQTEHLFGDHYPELSDFYSEFAKPHALIIFCNQNSGKKLQILNSIISDIQMLKIVNRQDFISEFGDTESNHHSSTHYEMVTISKRKQDITSCNVSQSPSH